VLTVIREGVVTVTEAEGTQHSFNVNDGFIAFDSNKLTVAVERGSQLKDGQQD
jgi:F-type H+-transporting ATPase subunit epsilon